MAEQDTVGRIEQLSNQSGAWPAGTHAAIVGSEPRQWTPIKLTPDPKGTPHRCPVCEGRGTVAQDFYPGPEAEIGFRHQCRSCKGEGVLWG